MKKPILKVAYYWPIFFSVLLTRNQPKSYSPFFLFFYFLFHKNCSPHDLCIMTLPVRVVRNDQAWLAFSMTMCRGIPFFLAISILTAPVCESWVVEILQISSTLHKMLSVSLGCWMRARYWSDYTYGNCKGQLISKANFEVFIWTKKRTKNESNHINNGSLSC